MSNVSHHYAMQSKPDLYKAHQAGQEKYTYFLLTVAGAAVAFATQKTEGAHVSWWMLPLAAAVVLWGSSFYIGCQAVRWSHTVIRREIYLLNAIERSSEVDGALGQKLLESHSQHLDQAVQKMSSYEKWQFQLLVAGGVLYCSWRIAEMVRLSP